MKSIIKKITLIILIAINLSNIHAQENIKTLLGSVQKIGGYGDISYRYFNYEKLDGFMSGGSALWIIKPWMRIGLSGFSFETEAKFDTIYNDYFQYTGYYGGLLFEPALFSNKPVHLTFPALIGAGGFSYSTKDINDNRFILNSEVYMFYEQGIEIETNIFSFFRLSLGAYYRQDTFNGFDLKKIPADIKQNFSIGITMKFGSW